MISSTSPFSHGFESIFIASFCSLSFSPPLVAFLAVLTCLPRYLYLGAICWIKLSLWI